MNDQLLQRTLQGVERLAKELSAATDQLGQISGALKSVSAVLDRIHRAERRRDQGRMYARIQQLRGKTTKDRHPQYSAAVEEQTEPATG